MGRHSGSREAFQRFRKHSLDGDYYATFSNVNLGVCLDECVRDDGLCASVIYSESFRECRLSRYNQAEMELMYDEKYDYFESLRRKCITL